MPTKTAPKRAPAKKPAPKKAAAKRAAAAPKEPERASEVTIELPARLLANVLKNALVAACKDDLRPILCAAAVQCEEGKVLVVSTDSYRLLVQEFPLEGVKPSEQFVVDRAALVLIERLARAVKQPPKKRRPRWMAPDTSAPQTATLTLTKTTASFASNGTKVEHSLKVQGDFPGWRNLVADVPAKIETGQSGTSVAVNGKFLADLARLHPLVEQTPTLVISPQNALKPVRVEVSNRDGYRVYALLMPVRTS